MGYKLRTMYVSLIFYILTTLNFSIQSPLVFISFYFVHERKQLYVSGNQV